MTGPADSSTIPPEFPVLPPLAPQSPARWRRYLGILLMRLSGWRIDGNIPNVPKYVLIVAPHMDDEAIGAGAYAMLRFAGAD